MKEFKNYLIDYKNKRRDCPQIIGRAFYSYIRLGKSVDSNLEAELVCMTINILGATQNKHLITPRVAIEILEIDTLDTIVKSYL